MNVDEPREPTSTEGTELGDGEPVEVLVEDLFIEEYETPLVQASDPRSVERERSRLARAVRPLRSHGKSLLAGLLALGGLALATLFLNSGRKRKVSRLSRLVRALGMAR
ncbi:MAG: hypothetical protein KIS78_31310 [Labilithrix sp.]|nr:hypothetical protein [Labilithrix sp.]MCW5836924.1 hypothetical protein [Labilithrix sp.]